MTKIDGHRFYDQNYGRGLAYLSMSDRTWQILRARSITKWNGRASKSAQIQIDAFHGPSPKSSPIFFGRDLLTDHFYPAILFKISSLFILWARKFIFYSQLFTV
jgi:hypothetical protein